jgi:predicted ATPase
MPYVASPEWARGQQAKFWELRTANSLALLWYEQGKCMSAKTLLRPIYDWFTGGSGTRDLRVAKALLENLSQP